MILNVMKFEQLGLNGKGNYVFGLWDAVTGASIATVLIHSREYEDGGEEMTKRLMATFAGMTVK